MLKRKIYYEITSKEVDELFEKHLGLKFNYWEAQGYFCVPEFDIFYSTGKLTDGDFAFSDKLIKSNKISSRSQYALMLRYLVFKGALPRGKFIIEINS